MAVTPIGGVERSVRTVKPRKRDGTSLAVEIDTATSTVQIVDTSPPAAAPPTSLVTPATALAAQEQGDDSGNKAKQRRPTDDEIPEDWRR